MSLSHSAAAELYTANEIARAAGASLEDVRALLETDDLVILHGRFVPFDTATRLVRKLGHPRSSSLEARRLFAPATDVERRHGLPFAASGAIHVGLLGIFLLITGLGVRTEPEQRRNHEPARLVFLATRGPGGGGGGGGLRQPLPPPRAERRGTSKLKSPVSVTKKTKRPEAPPVETPRPAVPEPTLNPLPPPPATSPTPPVVAPVVTASADPADRAGVVAEPVGHAPSNGPGAGGGSGSGRGSGMGEGAGAGIGDGSIAGMGGGPYRPGSGITPPNLLHEVKPVYTDDARRRGVEGDVVMEVVVRGDGSVGSVRVVQGLGSGLDQRATEAVRQWRFSPARRLGAPVDVLVEVAVEFRLR